MSSLPQTAMVLVATGTKAKVFTMSNKGQGLSLRFDDDLEPGNLADQGPAGKSPPEQSAAESMETTFSKILSNWLYYAGHAGKFDSLILIADPDTLGEMRPLLHQEVSNKMVLELDKTLVNAPMDDIVTAITKASGTL